MLTRFLLTLAISAASCFGAIKLNPVFLDSPGRGLNTVEKRPVVMSELQEVEDKLNSMLDHDATVNLGFQTEIREDYMDGETVEVCVFPPRAVLIDDYMPRVQQVILANEKSTQQIDAKLLVSHKATPNSGLYFYLYNSIKKLIGCYDAKEEFSFVGEGEDDEDDYDDEQERENAAQARKVIELISIKYGNKPRKLYDAVKAAKKQVIPEISEALFLYYNKLNAEACDYNYKDFEVIALALADNDAICAQIKDSRYTQVLNELKEQFAKETNTNAALMNSEDFQFRFNHYCGTKLKHILGKIGYDVKS